MFLLRNKVKHTFILVSLGRLAGKKHRQIKLQRLQKLGILAFGSLLYQVNSL